MTLDHEYWMREAVTLARNAEYFGDRPFGCVILDPGGALIAAGSGSESVTDPTRHSEIRAIREACAQRQGLLQGCTLYSTHEPCAMCIGAINHSKVSRVVYGSSRRRLTPLFRDRHCGAAALLADTSHPPEVITGVLEEECVALFDAERGIAPTIQTID